MKKMVGFAVVALALVLSAAPVVAGSSHGGIKLGVLSCKKVGGGYNLLIHSVTNVRCEFSSSGGKETYNGETGVALGLNLEWNPDETILYAVFAGTSDIRMGAHALAGNYFGAKVSASVGVGTGVQVLVGGGDKNITLQPFALEGSTGIGASGGVSYLYLRAAR